MMNNDKKTCSICYKKIDEHKDANGKVYWSSGHNAQPLVADDTTHPSMVSHGRCCDSCNGLVVQVRMMQAFGQHSTANLIIKMFKDCKYQSDVILAHMRLVMAFKSMGDEE